MHVLIYDAAAAFSYYGMTLRADSLPGNVYDVFAIMSAVEAPAVVVRIPLPPHRHKLSEIIVTCTSQEHPRAPQPACVRAEAQPGPLLLAGACHNSLGSSERKGDELLPLWWWCWGFSRRC